MEVGAHGLLYAFDALYVMVNEQRGKSGLWRVRSTKGDDTFDQIEFLRPMNGSGEHGPHALVLGPDGNSIYFANGNHTDLPRAMEQARMVAWGEDHLIPRMWDARGHARNKFAPGGYIARTDRDGRPVVHVSRYADRRDASGAGPDANRLICGSEGTLGVVTEAVMRVRPRPTFRGNASVHFKDFDKAVMQVVKEYVVETKAIRFEGNNYAEEWGENDAESFSQEIALRSGFEAEVSNKATARKSVSGETVGNDVEIAL